MLFHAWWYYLSLFSTPAIRTAAINEAEGRKQAIILKAQGARMERELLAAGTYLFSLYLHDASYSGEAEAIRVRAKATAEAIARIAEAIRRERGAEAVSLSVAEKYVDAFSKIAKEGNTVLLPTNTGDVGSMVAQALSIFDAINKQRSVSARESVKRGEPEQEAAQQEEEESQVQEEEPWEKKRKHSSSVCRRKRRSRNE